MRAFLHYFFAWIFLTYYGVEVCPYIESLGFRPLIMNLGIFFAIFFAIRFLRNKSLMKLSQWEKIPAKIMRLDLVIFMLMGISLSAFNLLYYKFPAGSGLKIVIGCATFGFFASLDNYLSTERSVINKISQHPEYQSSSRRFFPLPAKFAAISVTLALFTAAVILLLIAKDFEWLSQNAAAKGIAEARRSVMFEVLFVFAILLAYAILLIISYAKNLKLYFKGETEVLEKVAVGSYDGRVPVVSNDEFGQIAGHTNRMIEGLRERDRIRHVFGKVVSPEIAERLIASGGAITGSRRTLSILFADVRNFTGMSEGVSGEELIRNLNLYLTEMVQIIKKHNGYVDKFIGDGILAVFGLEHTNETLSAYEAFKCAEEMQARTREIQAKLTLPFETGVGIHFGEAIAGIIGSEDRFEFTVIGDAVNTASRLESLCKETGHSVILSGELLAALKENANSFAQKQIKNLGLFALRGRKEQKEVYGLLPATA